MKQILLLAVALILSFGAMAQTQHFTFRDIPSNGTVEEVIDRQPLEKFSGGCRFGNSLIHFNLFAKFRPSVSDRIWVMAVVLSCTNRSPCG